MALQLGVGVVATAVVAKTIGPGLMEFAAGWTLDRLHDIDSSQPIEEKTRARRIRNWRRTLGNGDKDKRKYKIILGPLLRDVYNSYYSKEFEVELFINRYAEPTISPRELVWFRHPTDGNWRQHTALIIGGDEHDTIVTPAAALAMGYMSEGGMTVLPELRNKALGRKGNINSIESFRFSICGIEFNTHAIVRPVAVGSLASSSTMPPPEVPTHTDAFVILPVWVFARVVQTHRLVLKAF